MKPPNRKLRHESICLLTLACGLIFSVEVSAADFSSRDYPVGHMPTRVFVHDFNKDGKLDLAVLNVGDGTVNDGTVSILLGNGDGTFQTAHTFSSGGVNPTSIGFADFNGDGKLDLAIGGFQIPGQPTCGASAVNILLGNGDGTFQTPQQAVSVNLINNLVTAGDLNADGKPDLVVFRFPQNADFCEKEGFSVFLGNGDGTFQAEKQISGSPLDVNGDGIPDLADVSRGLNLFLGLGNGRYKPFASGPENNAGLLAFGDFNNDQIQDQAQKVVIFCNTLYCETSTSYVGVSLGNGDGTFQPAKLFPPGGYVLDNGSGTPISEIAPGDFNGDGNLDVAYINFGTSTVTFLLGKGDGTLPTLLTFDSGSGEDSFVVADLNNDGKPDLVTANLNDDTISVILNTFPATGSDLAVQLSVSPEPVSVSQKLTYSTVLQNRGPQDASNVVFTDNLPPNVSFGSASIDHGNCTEAQQMVVCNISKLVSGDTAIATIVVTPTTTGTISDTLNVSADESDPDTANNSATHSTRVDPMFKLTITKSGTGTGTVAGGGINCGQTCTVSLPTQTTTNLQVTPGSNSGFGGWGGACAQEFAAPGCDITMSADQTVTAEFDPLPNFTFWLGFLSMSVQEGKSSTVGVELVAEGASFNNSIALTCSVQGASPAPTCSFSPGSVSIPDQNAVASNLTIATTAPHAAVARPPNGASVLYAFLFPVASITLVAIGRRRTGKMLSLALCTVICAMAVSATSCGGSGQSSGSTQLVGGTPRGNYTVTIAGTSGSIQHSVSIPLTVQ